MDYTKRKSLSRKNSRGTIPRLLLFGSIFFKEIADGNTKNLCQAVQLNICYGSLLVLDPGDGTTADVDSQGLQLVGEGLLTHLLLKSEFPDPLANQIHLFSVNDSCHARTPLLVLT